MLSGQALRNFALALLDDPHGINVEAYDSLHDMLTDDGQEDIAKSIQKSQGRYYLMEDRAQELRAVTVN